MAVKKRRSPPKTPNGKRQEEGEAARMRGKRLRRTDDEKIQLVRQVMASGNQSAEIKKLGIYPNQFYDWKKKFAGQIGGGGASAGGNGARGARGRSVTISAARSAADEAKAFIEGKAKLLERLRNQRAELDELIAQLEG